MTLTFESDLSSVKMNQHAKYQGQRSFRSKVIIGTHVTNTHHTNYSTWTSKVIGNYPIKSYGQKLFLL